MSSFRYTQEMIDYVREIAPGKPNREITELLNKKFGLNKTVSQINSLKSNYGITSGPSVRRLPRKHLRMFNEDHEKFVKENVKGKYNKELTEMLNKEFGTNYTIRQVKALKQRNKWSSGLSGRFEKGHPSWNKGMKGLYFAGSEKGWFKKGQKPNNYRPIGSERICNKDGYVIVKVQDEGTWPERWRHKHVVEWEKVNGEVPESHIVTFLDQDQTNTDIENLMLISRRAHAYLNKEGGLTNDPDINLAKIALAELNAKLDRVELTKGDEKEYQYYEDKAIENGIQVNTFKIRLKRGWDIREAASKAP